MGDNSPFAARGYWGFAPTVNSVQATTLYAGDEPDYQGAEMDSGGYSGPFAGSSFLGQPFAVWLGMILILVLLKFLSESPKTSINPAKIEIGGYNFIAVGVSAAVFTMLLKIIFNKFPVPGITQFANAL